MKSISNKAGKESNAFNVKIDRKNSYCSKLQPQSKYRKNFVTKAYFCNKKQMQEIKRVYFV